MTLRNIIYICLLLLSGECTSQSEMDSIILNKISIEITDVVTRQQLFNLKFQIASENDTTEIQVDSINPLVVKLPFELKYELSVIKEEYDTVTVQIENPSDSAEIKLEFFLPKKSLSQKEKRIAHKNFKLLSPENCIWCGGFKRIKPNFFEMCLSRTIIYHSKGPIRTSYVMAKLKNY